MCVHAGVCFTGKRGLCYFNYKPLVYLDKSRCNFFKDFIHFFLERGREGQRKGEKPQCVFASHALPTGDLAHNPGMCPDWESNQQPFGSQSGAESTELHQPRLNFKVFLRTRKLLLSMGLPHANTACNAAIFNLFHLMAHIP